MRGSSYFRGLRLKVLFIDDSSVLKQVGIFLEERMSFLAFGGCVGEYLSI